MFEIFSFYLIFSDIYYLKKSFIIIIYRIFCTNAMKNIEKLVLKKSLWLFRMNFSFIEIYSQI